MNCVAQSTCYLHVARHNHAYSICVEMVMQIYEWNFLNNMLQTNITRNQQKAKCHANLIKLVIILWGYVVRSIVHNIGSPNQHLLTSELTLSQLILSLSLSRNCPCNMSIFFWDSSLSTSLSLAWSSKNCCVVLYFLSATSI